MAEWLPTQADMRGGQDAYIRYLSGICIINAPQTAMSLGIAGEGHEEGVELLAHAEKLMYDGLRRIIQYAHEPKYRSDLQKFAEHNFNVALPRMYEIVDTAYEQRTTRITAMNAALDGLRPAPMLEEKPYKALCHSRKHLLHTAMLMDGLQPSKTFESLLENRTLASVREARLTGSA